MDAYSEVTIFGKKFIHERTHNLLIKRNKHGKYFCFGSFDLKREKIVALSEDQEKFCKEIGFLYISLQKYTKIISQKKIYLEAKKLVREAIFWLLTQPRNGRYDRDNDWFIRETTLQEFIKENTIFLLKELSKMKPKNVDSNNDPDVFDPMWKMFPTLSCFNDADNMKAEFRLRLLNIYNMLDN